MKKTIAQLYLEKHEQLSEKEKEVLLKVIELENNFIFFTTGSEDLDLDLEKKVMNNHGKL